MISFYTSTAPPELQRSNRNLVIAAVGDQSLHQSWMQGGKSFDIWLIHYGSGAAPTADRVIQAKGSKFHLIQDVLSTIDLEQYDYIWMPDDDVVLTGAEIDRLFDFMIGCDLWLAQPSLMGWYGVAFNLHQQGVLMRYTNFVEIMCPCFSRYALKLCMPYFKENYTGWSYDALWNFLLDHPIDKLAIIDDIVAIHTRPVFGGDIYQQANADEKLKAALADAGIIQKKYLLYKENEKDVCKGSVVNSEIHCAVVYKTIQKELENGVPRSERCWPHCDSLKGMVQSLRQSYVGNVTTPDATASDSLQQNEAPSAV